VCGGTNIDFFSSIYLMFCVFLMTPMTQAGQADRVRVLVPVHLPLHDDLLVGRPDAAQPLRARHRPLVRALARSAAQRHNHSTNAAVVAMRAQVRVPGGEVQSRGEGGPPELGQAVRPKAGLRLRTRRSQPLRYSSAAFHSTLPRNSR
jgi:hypothetical protein